MLTTKIKKMKFSLQRMFQKAKPIKCLTYRLKVEVSFLANFFVHYEKEKNTPIIREFYATDWNIELNFPAGYNVGFKVFVRNPSSLKGETAVLSIENMDDDGGILVKKFELNNANPSTDAEWFRLSVQ
jgi:hypothetical protein